MRLTEEDCVKWCLSKSVCLELVLLEHDDGSSLESSSLESLPVQ